MALPAPSPRIHDFTVVSNEPVAEASIASIEAFTSIKLTLELVVGSWLRVPGDTRQLIRIPLMFSADAEPAL